MDTLKSMKTLWDDQLAKIKDVHFSNSCRRKHGRCYIYGAVPSLASLHNLDELIYLKNGTWAQKDN